MSALSHDTAFWRVKTRNEGQGTMSAKEYDLSRVEQMAELTPEEFKRMLPDLKAWYAMARFVTDGEPSAVPHTFRWRDDGNPGVVTSVAINGQAVDLSGGKA